MALEETADCDGSCSGLDTIGQEIVSNADCNREYNKAVRPSFAQRYFEFSVSLRDNHPTAYKVLRFFGF